MCFTQLLKLHIFPPPFLLYYLAPNYPNEWYLTYLFSSPIQGIPRCHHNYNFQSSGYPSRLGSRYLKLIDCSIWLLVNRTWSRVITHLVPLGTSYYRHKCDSVFSPLICPVVAQSGTNLLGAGSLEAGLSCALCRRRHPIKVQYQYRPVPPTSAL